MILDKEKLLQDGFLSFNLKDVDLILYEELHTDFLNILPINIINHLRYDSALDTNIVPTELIDDYFTKLINDCGLNSNSSINYTLGNVENNYSTNLWLKLQGNYESLVCAESSLDKVSLSNQKMQVWYYGEFSSIQYPKIPTTLYNIYKKIISELYPNNQHSINNTIKDNILNSELTLYKKNNFIDTHKDAYDGSRLCVILIYLNDDYQKGYGGEIVIESKTKVEPNFGNIVVLDFTQNNAVHHVEKVLNDEFKRYAFIKFFFQ
jgi:Rps23 Pro-64 3,4-dihydroxylase Tpa1-like proline 4-hydroxylase